MSRLSGFGRVRHLRHVGPVILSVLVVSILDSGRTHAAETEALVILPKTVVLNGPKARQALIVERTLSGRVIGQVTDGLSLESSDPKIVRVTHGVAIPLADGKATIRARWKDR